MELYYKEDNAKVMFEEILNSYKDSTSFNGKEYSYTELLTMTDPQELERLFNIWITKCKSASLLNNQISSDVNKNTIWNPTMDRLNILRQAEALAKEVADGNFS
tara:strand:+ start:95 stop:406 length:312 start_codon:yes stop_codon:yes gene_type:complete